MPSNTHEDFDRAHVASGSSDRGFGFVFTGFFLLVGLWPLVHKRPIRLWAVCVGAVFLLIALIAPKLLHGLNLLWARFGLLLSKITNPIVTTLMFHVVFTPAAFLLRLAGKDPLRIRGDAVSSYWLERKPPGPTPETMRNQF